MTGYQDAQYRLKVARGFLGEGRQDVELGRWRSAVDNAQLAVENAEGGSGDDCPNRSYAQSGGSAEGGVGLGLIRRKPSR